ncbi:hypothetical protein JCM10908_003337 [Rhodotorula pacifica]|uniref:uncharacterized protein n=1 Tax=Rhodotorula pacifica TaxID=1495444 RepID=UPI00316D43C3
MAAMNAALASMHSQRTSTPSTAQANLNSDLDPLRLRLVQLIDSVTHLHLQLSHQAYSSPLPPSTSHPGLPPFPDLVARYLLLLSNLSAIHGLLSSEQDKERELERERREGVQPGLEARRRRQERETRDLKREKWDKRVVVPATRVDEAKDWIVGTLLRTKQTPEVESAQQQALSSLPEPFLYSLTNPASSSVPHPASESFATLSAAQSRLLQLAHQKIQALKEFSGQQDQEEWDWKARVELDPDSSDEDEDGEEAREKKEEGVGGGAGGRKWTLQEIEAFMQSGKRPTDL